MKIEYVNKIKVETPLSEVPAGECFLWGGDVFIRTRSEHSTSPLAPPHMAVIAVRVIDGHLISLGQGLEVQPIQVKLLVGQT